jgi:hypothetical protein
MSRVILQFLLFLAPIGVAAQNMVPYDIDFSFNDGIYLSFSDFKSNNPIPVTYLISNHDIRLPDYMELVLEPEQIRYYDNLGEERMVKTSSLWGYSFAGKAFIQYGDGFFRMPIFGAVTLFSAAVTTYRVVNDPTMMNPGMMPYQTMPVQELKQFLLNMQTGKVSPYTIENTLEMMISAPDLVAEFTQLKRKKQEEGLLLLIRKYNDRFPVYFPE